ncbi:MAG: choice-of-anchor D domain-containing protein [Deltaproteobacteria bacterium]|nr:choice-of-anchor D domain-containing protein [Deltaproteobacteria bacterium]
MLNRYALSALLLLAASRLPACGGDGSPSDSGPTTCTTDSDCPLGSFCHDGICESVTDGGPECIYDSDCEPDEICRNGRCVGETPDGGRDGGGDAGGEPDIAVDPAFLDFGNGRIGQPVSLQLSIRNQGDADLHVSSISFEQGTSAEFEAEPLGLVSLVIAAGNSRAVDVRYTPADGRMDEGALLIVSDDQDEPLVRVPISSSYKGSSEIAAVDDPASSGPEVEVLDFGQVSVGGASAHSVYIKNLGTADAVLTVEEVRVEPLSSPHFSVEIHPATPAFFSPDTGPCEQDSDCEGEATCVDGTCTGTDGYPVGMLTARVLFSPSSEGLAQASLVITDDEDDSAGDGDERLRIISLRGEGIQASLEVTPFPIDFGEHYAGAQVEMDVQLANAGGELLRIIAVELRDGAAGFSLDGGGGLWDVQPGERVQVTIRFHPEHVGEHADALSIQSTDPDHPDLSVDVLGRAVAPPAIEARPPALEFGQVQLGAQGSASVEIHNTGAAVLHVGDLSIEGPAAAKFGLVQTALPAIQPGGFESLDLTYSPSGSISTDAAVLVVESDDPVQPALEVPLSGLGTDPVLDADPLLVDFGSVYHGYTAGPEAVSVRNVGFGSLTVTQLGMTSGSNEDFSLSGAPASPVTLQPGESIPLELRFTPTGVGPRSASIQIDSSDRDRPTVYVQIAGEASECPPGFWDVDGLPHNGCEYECTLSNGGQEGCDDRDNDCDGETDEEIAPQPCERSNGYGRCTGTAICEDGDWVQCTAELPEQETCDGDDEDCDALVDADDPSLLLEPCEKTLGVCAGARHERSRCSGGAWVQCDGTEYGPAYLPPGSELCDGLDNDCDGLTDEPSDLVLAPCANQQGECADSLHSPDQCQNGAWAACEAGDYGPFYGLETCDGRDNDCNGLVDSADPGMQIQPCAQQLGVCQGSTHRPSLCIGGSFQACDFIDYGSDYIASGEICDGLDNDCDGTPDQGLSTRPCDRENAWGTCSGTEFCQGALGWQGCNAPAASEEICDGVDNDCDGATDGDDPSLELAPCELQAGVCAGAVHRASQCLGPGWALCEGLDYQSHSAYYGPEICGNGLDEDCSGQANDKDVDGDGHIDEACGGTDCDDLDPNTHPGAPEVQDAADNDCDDLVDEGLIPAGAVIISEIMQNPSAVDDNAGEWFEVTNVSGATINLRSWEFYDADGPDWFLVTDDILLEPNSAAVLCVFAYESQNGGVACDFDYDSFILAQAGDEVIAALDGFEIDRVEYDGGASFPNPNGHSMSLDPAAYDWLDNDDGANWCATPTAPAYRLPGGDYATPGDFNASCSGALSVLDVQPSSGILAGGETITLTGTGFDASVTVTLGSLACGSIQILSATELSCVTPAQAAPGDYDVRVDKGVNSDTLAGGYRYTDEASSPGIGWCDLQHPPSTSTNAGTPTPLLFGRVYKAGVTEPAGPPAGISAQVGYGPHESDPRFTPGWLWVDSVWNPSCPDCGNNDEFMQTLTLTEADTYSYAYRFSEDGGYTFVFCDYDPGTADGFSRFDLGELTVAP